MGMARVLLHGLGLKKNNFSIVRGKELLRWYSTSKKSEFGFCSRCGSSILYRSIKCPNEIHITLINIFDNLNITPQSDNYFDTHVPWLIFDESIPKKNDPKLEK